ncbi:17675_t:CDS:2, partial [Gigaspora margarita]
MARENDYDQPQSLFSSLLETIPHNSVKEIIDYTKKALDLAIQADKVEEFVSNASFISIEDPLHIPYKGRQPKKYKSGNEPSRKSNEDEIQKVTEALNSDVSALQDSEKK